MTGWLTEGEAFSNFGIEDECELKLPEEDGAVVRAAASGLYIPM